jgi:transposase
MAFRTREMFVRQRTQASNALRSHLSEIGVIADTGRPSLKLLMKAAADNTDQSLPQAARFALRQVVQGIEFLQARIAELDREIRTRARHDEVSRRLMTVPGVGPLIASAVRSLVLDPSSFKSGRDFAAWIGLTPKSNSSGGRHVVGHISKMGNAQLRALMFSGAASVIGHLKEGDTSSWLGRLKQRRPFKVVAVAMANKMARIIWALLVKGGTYAPRCQTAVQTPPVIG